MEVKSEQAAPPRESFGAGLQGSAVQSPPVLPNMRMSFTADGSAVYLPLNVPPAAFQSKDGSTAAVPLQGLQMAAAVASELPLKKKRGRPRKYGPDGTMALALSPLSGQSAGSPLSPLSSASPGMKKARGRPPGSGRKQQMAALGSAGIGFTPHVITVKAGEDVASKIMSFSQHGPRAVCILTANGSISNVTLRQAAMSGGTVTYEGRFEILSLSGSFLLTENGGQRSRTGGMSVSLAGPDGRVLGGGVAGQLTAASPIQVVVGSFIADGGARKEAAKPPNFLEATTGPPPAPAGNLSSSGGPASPQSRGTPSPPSPPQSYNNGSQPATVIWK